MPFCDTFVSKPSPCAIPWFDKQHIYDRWSIHLWRIDASSSKIKRSCLEVSTCRRAWTSHRRKNLLLRQKCTRAEMVRLETTKGTKNRATRTLKTSNASQRHISIDKGNNYVDLEIFRVLYTPKTLRHIIIYNHHQQNNQIAPCRSLALHVQ